MPNDDEFIEHTFDGPAPAIKSNDSNKECEFRPSDNITIDDVISLDSWLQIILKKDGLHFDEPKLDLNIYGDNDDKYLVINHYTSKTSANVYLFKTDDRINPLASLIQWLGCIKYNLRELLELLETSHYYETDMGLETRCLGMVIKKTPQGKMHEESN